uniref:KRAB domain-containing protein n=1 Tax=Buteo japonicus TaxID=224669 RepID=A0A8B9Z6P2_9AVES
QAGGGLSTPAPVTFEDVEVWFSVEEWELLEEWQRDLHREVTEGTSQLLASLGRALPRCSSQPEWGSLPDPVLTGAGAWVPPCVPRGWVPGMCSAPWGGKRT